MEHKVGNYEEALEKVMQCLISLNEESSYYNHLTVELLKVVIEKKENE